MVKSLNEAIKLHIPFLENKYKKWYMNIVSNEFDGEYYEKHHILPKSLFPEYVNCSWNIVKLSAKAHFIAHKLLIRIVKGIALQKMHYALFLMASLLNKKNKISSNSYGKIKEQYSITLNNGIHFNFGLIRSEETKEKIRIKRKLQIISKDVYEKTSKIMKELIWMNDGKRNYRIRPENLEKSKDKGFIIGRLSNNFTEEYRNKLKLAAKKQWQKVKQTGHNGHLIKV